MKATGIVRKLDQLGRIVLPKELRLAYDINIGDSIEVFVEGNAIILKKYEPACFLCGEAANTYHYMGKVICSDCISHFKDMDL